MDLYCKKLQQIVISSWDPVNYRPGDYKFCQLEEEGEFFHQ